jgi:uncharacterized protein
MGVQWVIKASKLCNLRCRYCYEYPHLGDPKRLNQEQLKRFFGHVADHYAGEDQEQDFVWHGGEPLLLGAGYFDEAFRMQEETLGRAGVPYSNSIQTNLYRLHDRDFELLRRFANVGVSVDVFGTQRVNANGADAQEAILKNMERLFAQDIPFGCITVLSKENIDHVERIYAFFAELGVSFRLLPIYRTGFLGQQDHLGLSPQEILQAFIRTFDRWANDETEIQVRPIEDHVTTVIRKHMGGTQCMGHYSKRPGEALFVMDCDGRVYSNADAYAEPFAYGNVCEQPMNELLSSSGYRRTRLERQQRVDETCSRCDWFGACSGFYVAEATPEQRWSSMPENDSCQVVKPLLEHIERHFIEAGLIARDDGRLLVDPAPYLELDSEHKAFQYF